MKNYALILLLISVSCNQQDREPKQHKITTQPDLVTTKKQKHAQIEALFSKHDGYDHLNILKNYFGGIILPISMNFYWVKFREN